MMSSSCGAPRAVASALVAPDGRRRPTASLRRVAIADMVPRNGCVQVAGTATRFDRSPRACIEYQSTRKYVNMADINFKSDDTPARRPKAPAPADRDAAVGDRAARDRRSSSCSSSPIATSPPTPTPHSSRYGFGRAHHRVLHFVNRHPGIRVADLLDILKITKQSLGRVLKQLVDTGFIEQRPGPRDRRQRLLYPTASRPRAGARASPTRSRAASRAALAELSPAERDGAERFLRLIDQCRASATRSPQPDRSADRQRRHDEHDATDTGAPVDDDAPHLLVVDDDTRIRTLLRAISASTASASPSPATPPRRAGSSPASTSTSSIVDVMMPGENGIELTESLRADDDVPILMLTARCRDREPHRRAREPAPTTISPSPSSRASCCCASTTSCAAARRPAPPLIEQLASAPSPSIASGCELKRGGETVHLTDRERQILAIFAAAPGETVPRARAGRRRRPRSASAPSTCRSTGCAARSRPIPANPLYLQTVRGIGYRLAIAGIGRADGRRPMSDGTIATWPKRRLADRRGIRGAYGAASRAPLGDAMPKGLYARSLLIIITPMVLLQSVVAFVFMERHWQTVTARLSAAVSRDIAAIIDIIETYPQDADYADDHPHRPRAARPQDRRPAAGAAAAARAASRSSRSSTGSSRARSPGRSASPSGSTRSAAPTSSRSASSSTTRCCASSPAAARPMPPTRTSSCLDGRRPSLVLLTIAILFLRNQIRPILQLAEAAESFGKGRAVRRLPAARRRARCARRRIAFIEMRERIERQIEQRTAMLTGVSHDLRTILTRFRLQLALIGDAPDIEALKQRRRRHAADARGLSRLRARRRRRGHRPTRPRRAASTRSADEAALRRRTRRRSPSPAIRMVQVRPHALQALPRQSRRQCLPPRRERRRRRQPRRRAR